MKFDEKGGVATADDTREKMREMEERAGVDDLEVLLHQRRQLIEQNARLRVLHGVYGRYDNLRKNMLSATKVKVRMLAKEKGEKTTEGAVEDEAHADTAYGAFVERGVSDAIEHVLLESKLEEIRDRIRNRELMLRAYANEPR